MLKENVLVDEKISCHHCGEDCADHSLEADGHYFCCTGCQTVYEILQENNLCTYYDLNDHAGISLKAKNFEGRFDYLNEETIEAQLLDFKSKEINKITLYLPSVHCSSCVWLLENFQKVQQGVLATRLNFLQKELTISYNPEKVSLKKIVELLATLGYEPLITLESSQTQPRSFAKEHALILRIGVVGFCFGNIMLLSFPEYFHLDLQNSVDAQYQRFFLYLNFLLSLPVFFFGASDYLKGAWVSLKENLKQTTTVLSVDIPIAVGITALFLRSTYETFFNNHSAGYWDSLAGLVFFLLLGKWVQQVTFNHLSFERNYTSYFPLAVKVIDTQLVQGFVYKNVSELEKNNAIIIHHQEIIPADALLTQGSGWIDYSFVTGESAPVRKEMGDLIYAGGRQMGERIELLVQKPVSQSYLTQLWNNEAFDKEKPVPMTRLANAFSKYFTYITLLIALATGIYWYFVNPNLAWTSLTAVLMVACPCALTLSMPFTMGAVMTIFGRNKFYVKNQGVIQQMTEIDEIVFDKTGTLTESSKAEVRFEGKKMNDDENFWIKTLASQSTHPLSKMIAVFLSEKVSFTNKKVTISDVKEVKGSGISGYVNGCYVQLGNRKFVGESEVTTSFSEVCVSIDNQFYGYFVVEPCFRKGWEETLLHLKKQFRLALFSGDNAAAKKILLPYFEEQNLLFNQKPQDKLQRIEEEQRKGYHVLMVGDGLNDAGALRKSDVGIALSEDTQAFSPASDAILDASQFGRIADFLRFSKTALRTVQASFVLSLVYNFVLISWAASGHLTPLFAAIAMPLSTITVVLFAVGLTYFFAQRRGLLQSRNNH